MRYSTIQQLQNLLRCLKLKMLEKNSKSEVFSHLGGRSKSMKALTLMGLHRLC